MPKSSASLFRAAWRIPWIVWVMVQATAEAWVMSRKPPSERDRACWTQRQARRLLRIFDIHFEAEGVAPTHGLIVCNHVSYTDILVMAASVPALFVSKAEVRSYPWLGWLTAQGGTIYIDRDRSARAQQVGVAVEQGMQRGVPVAFYPEGTTTDGNHLLRFRAALFAPAVRLALPVTPAAVRYAIAGGSVEQEVAFWGDMGMLSHLLHLLSLRGVSAKLQFGSSLDTGGAGSVEQRARVAANGSRLRVAAMLGMSPAGIAE